MGFLQIKTIIAIGGTQGWRVEATVPPTLRKFLLAPHSFLYIQKNLTFGSLLNNYTLSPPNLNNLTLGHHLHHGNSALPRHLCLIFPVTIARVQNGAKAMAPISANHLSSFLLITSCGCSFMCVSGEVGICK